MQSARGQDRPDRAAHDGLGPAGLEQQRPHPDPRRQRRALGRRQDPLRPRRRCADHRHQRPGHQRGPPHPGVLEHRRRRQREAPHPVSFGIDKTSPTIGHTQSPAANAEGWNNAAVTVTFSCSDARVRRRELHRSAARSPTEGQAQAVTGTVTRQRGQHRHRPGHGQHRPDQAHHHRRRPADAERARLVRRPTSPPPSPPPTPCPASRPRTAPTPSVRAPTRPPPRRPPTPPATAPRSPPRRSTSTRPPPPSPARSLGTANAEGWFAGDVTVHWTCDDNLSGVVACPDDSVVNGEGSDLSASRQRDRPGRPHCVRDRRRHPDRPHRAVDVRHRRARRLGERRRHASASRRTTTCPTSTAPTTPSTAPTRRPRATPSRSAPRASTPWSTGRSTAPATRGRASPSPSSVDLSSPSITPSQSPAQNANGWNNTDVAVSFSCVDQTDPLGPRGLHRADDRLHRGRGPAGHAARRPTTPATGSPTPPPPSTSTRPRRPSLALLTGSPTRLAGTPTTSRSPSTPRTASPASTP